LREHGGGGSLGLHWVSIGRPPWKTEGANAMNQAGFAARAASAAIALSLLLGPWTAAPAAAAGDRPLLAQAAGDDRAELAFWDAIKDSKNPDEFKAYLDTYPKGKFVALARVRMNALTKPAEPAAAPAAAPAVPAATSSSSSDLPKLPGQSGGASSPATAQPAATQAAPAAAPAKEEPKIEYWTASKSPVRVYPQPSARSAFLRDEYYVDEQSIKVIEVVPGRNKLPWLKVITPSGKEGYVFSGEARPAGVSRSGKFVQSPNSDD
jgi:hypothetical protein